MSEIKFPIQVTQNLQFFHAKGIWHIVSNNPPVKSCAEAASRRRRLGHIGIPLSDELKSTVGAYITESGRQFAVVHCRGHQKLEENKLRNALGSSFTRIDAFELSEQFGLQYGTVTPFAFAQRPDVRHVVDGSLLKRFFSPDTIMTNLGHLEYGVEFHAQDVFAALPNVLITDVVRDEDRRVPIGHTIGILTGNSPESGILLWEMINQRIRSHMNASFRGDTGFPRIIVDSVPGMGLSMEIVQRNTQVRPVVTDGVRRLCESGANLIGIACNTTQYYAPEIEGICNSYGAKFVSIVDETASFLEREGIQTFDFLAIGPVSDFNTWSDFRRISNRFDIHLPSAEDIEAITQLAFSVKREVVSSATVNRLRDLINRATYTDTVVLALTELSILFASQRKKQRSGKRFVDTLEILGQKMSDIYVAERAASGGG